MLEYYYIKDQDLKNGDNVGQYLLNWRVMRECIYLGVKFHYNNNKTKHRYDTYNFKDS